MSSAAYARAYRARRKAEGRPVDAGRDRRRCVRAPEDRTREYARRASRAIPRPPILYPATQRGVRLAFWTDELRLDLEQERALAVLEGRDPDEAAKAYAARETAWYRFAGPLLEWVA